MFRAGVGLPAYWQLVVAAELRAGWQFPCGVRREQIRVILGCAGLPSCWKFVVAASLRSSRRGAFRLGLRPRRFLTIVEKLRAPR